MILAVTLSSILYTIQKLLMMDCQERKNPIHPFELTYWLTLILFVMYGLTFHYLGASFFPIPKEVRLTYVCRCVIGMMCNLSFLVSLQFIPFSKASVFFWTSPVFTGILARYYLNERLSYYDCFAVVICFFGILLIQNPFGNKESEAKLS